MNNRAKGALHEKRVADYLIRGGYLVERGFKKAAFIQGRMMTITKDLFGAYDLLAIKADAPTRMIQVHAGSSVGPRVKKAFGVHPSGEVWEHIKAFIYRIHRYRKEPEVLDIRRQSTPDTL